MNQITSRLTTLLTDEPEHWQNNMGWPMNYFRPSDCCLSQHNLTNHPPGGRGILDKTALLQHHMAAADSLPRAVNYCLAPEEGGGAIDRWVTSIGKSINNNSTNNNSNNPNSKSRTVCLCILCCSRQAIHDVYITVMEKLNKDTEDGAIYFG